MKRRFGTVIEVQPFHWPDIDCKTVNTSAAWDQQQQQTQQQVRVLGPHNYSSR
ncbi:hypothetical protein ElyMa_007012700 [Elysia marginata]|uniref:Uncharacterized protein n=1 Tax=Elysia marginata TaxID=1093978 RepID=A0AAV4JR12_9GAST|nr:hypothetical protein ElyMa_007012700 [Elysia marginata]